jgi:hypothetical protein
MAEGIGRMGYGEDRGGAISFVRIDREKEASVGQGMPVTIIKLEEKGKEGEVCQS